MTRTRQTVERRRLVVTILGLGIAMAGVAGPASPVIANPGSAAGQATAVTQAAKRPLAGTALALAFGKVPAVAWLARSPGGTARVYAAAPAEAPGTALGPTRAGRDGLPAAAATIKGDVWIVAARSEPSGSRLWAQAWRGGQWEPALTGPSARTWDHHPTAAAGKKGLWVAWIGEDESSADAAIFASRWTGSSWTPEERLPRVAGTPMAPSIAVGDNGRPIVAWAASDGADAEIWLATRGSSGWSSPHQLTNNEFPDITPSIAARAGRLLVAWVSFTPTGYVPTARLQSSGGTWQPAQRLSSRPGTHPVAMFSSSDAVVLWGARLANRQVLRSTVRRDNAWGPVINLATATGTRAAAGAGSDGRLALAWRRPDGTLAAAEGEIDAGESGSRGAVVRVTRSLSGPAQSQTSAASVLLPLAESGTVPHNFSAFGDSITLGIVVLGRNPLIVEFTPGYVGPLTSMLEDVFGPVTISNDGVGGELTSEGLSRIAGVIRARRPDSLLLMEGTNDVTFFVDPPTIAFNLQQMINRAKASQPGIITFLGMIIPRDEGWDNELNRRTDEVNELLIGVAEATGATLVDTHTALDGQGSLFSDHVHPNEDGYEVLAGAWYDVVEPELLSLTNLGDIDDSGRVDGADLVFLGIAFGSAQGDSSYSAAADINQDGMVDGFDLAILADHFSLDVESSGG